MSRTDVERLDWLEKECIGSALVSDDAGMWAVVGAGTQNVVSNPPQDVQTTFFIEKYEWSPSVREAIDDAIAREEAEAVSGE